MAQRCLSSTNFTRYLTCDLSTRNKQGGSLSFLSFRNADYGGGIAQEENLELAIQ